MQRSKTPPMWCEINPRWKKESWTQLEKVLKSIKHQLILHLREEEWDGGSENDWGRNVPQWLDPYYFNRNQVLDSGVNVFPCIFVASAAFNRSRPDSITCFVIQWNNGHVRLSCQFYILQASLYKLWPQGALISIDTSSYWNKLLCWGFIQKVRLCNKF